MVQTVLFSSLSIGVNLNTDIKKGVFDRFRSLPIARSAPLVGAVLADVVRFGVSVLVLMGFGYALGFRIGTDPLSALAGCLLVIVFALCLSWVFVYLGVLAARARGGAGHRLPADVSAHLRQQHVRPRRLPAGLAAGVGEGQPGQPPGRRRSAGC